LPEPVNFKLSQLFLCGTPSGGTGFKLNGVLLEGVPHIVSNGLLGFAERIGRENAHLFNYEGEDFRNYTNAFPYENVKDFNPTDLKVERKLGAKLFQFGFQQSDIDIIQGAYSVRKEAIVGFFGSQGSVKGDIKKLIALGLGTKAYVVSVKEKAEHIFFGRYGVRTEAEVTFGSLGAEIGVGKRGAKLGVHRGVGLAGSVEFFIVDSERNRKWFFFLD
jgi:hypothetical protein